MLPKMIEIDESALFVNISLFLFMLQKYHIFLANLQDLWQSFHIRFHQS